VAYAAVERALPGDTLVLPILEDWESNANDRAKLVWQCMLFTETILNSTDPKIVDMLFMQSVFYIIAGIYPCSQDEAVHLAALQFTARFGRHKPDVHKVGFLSATIDEYVPQPHLREAKLSRRDWEARIFEKHRTVMTGKPKEAYLELLKKRDYFGAVLFGAKQYYDRSVPKRVFLGISRKGILLLLIPESFTTGSMQVHARFPLGDIYRWAYKPGETFYFEIKSPPGMEAPEYRYKTPEGKHMSDLLTDYALALLREMGLNPDGSRREKKVRQVDGGAAGGGEAGEGLRERAVPWPARMTRTAGSVATRAPSHPPLPDPGRTTPCEAMTTPTTQALLAAEADSHRAEASAQTPLL
jgi:hypothetical protein